MNKKCVVVVPAFNEEAALPSVIGRVPRQMEDLDVEILLVDDGSTDRSVQVAREAGVDHVLSFPVNRGLGAAVREGLQAALHLGADLAVMIDADNEYPADEIPHLIAPILRDEADYVMGSRFKGTIKGMSIIRRLGNHVFTLLQSLLLRQWICDGQSGMRAFNREALQDLEIIHDYNYAQVMTLNLVRKGYRLVEIPIHYRVRTSGSSFIRFWPYVRHVVPAVWREMRKRPVRKREDAVPKIKGREHALKGEDVIWQR
jgi:glycosyltransferase involved in cell wall biosynthesis